MCLASPTIIVMIVLFGKYIAQRLFSFLGSLLCKAVGGKGEKRGKVLLLLYSY